MCFRRTGPYNPRHVEHILNRFVGNEFTFSLHAYKMQIMFIILKHIYHERLQVSKTTSVTKQTQAPHRIGIALMNCYRNGNRCFFRENKRAEGEGRKYEPKIWTPIYPSVFACSVPCAVQIVPSFPPPKLLM